MPAERGLQKSSREPTIVAAIVLEVSVGREAGLGCQRFPARIRIGGVLNDVALSGCLFRITKRHIY